MNEAQARENIAQLQREIKMARENLDKYLKTHQLYERFLRWQVIRREKAMHRWMAKLEK